MRAKDLLNIQLTSLESKVNYLRGMLQLSGIDREETYRMISKAYSDLSDCFNEFALLEEDQ